MPDTVMDDDAGLLHRLPHDEARPLLKNVRDATPENRRVLGGEVGGPRLDAVDIVHRIAVMVRDSKRVLVEPEA